MRLPGTRYQEHGWEQVRKLLGQCSLEALVPSLLGRLGEPAALSEYVDSVGHALARIAHTARGSVAGNSYGESVAELAMTLLYELQSRPTDWAAFAAGAAQVEGEALLRKKVNDMYAVLRDKVDADGYQVATGRPCSANKIYAYRMLDTAYGEIARLFAHWQLHAEQVGAILGRELAGTPIEARQLRAIGQCRAEWIICWSASLERFGGSPGPLHTRSKRFASLKNQPEQIQAMLAEIGEYESLSANRDAAWLQEAHDAGTWLDDLARVLHASEQAGAAGPDQLLEACADPFAEDDAAQLSPAPSSVEAEGSARMAGASLPLRLAVYQKVLGQADDSYPDDWLDPATGALPTMQQLASMEQVSLPTLRKRRDALIASLRGT